MLFNTTAGTDTEAATIGPFGDSLATNASEHGHHGQSAGLLARGQGQGKPPIVGSSCEVHVLFWSVDPKWDTVSFCAVWHVIGMK